MIKSITKKELKERVADLEGKLREVCVNPGSVRTGMIVHREKFKMDLEVNLWAGDFKETGRSFNGFIKQITKCG